MNAAGRLVHQGVLSRHLIRGQFLSGKHVTIAALALFILLTALSVIYVTHVTRVLHASLSHQLQEQDRLHVETGQLLLERSTWMIQSRVQQAAENKLGMIIPDPKSVIVIHE